MEETDFYYETTYVAQPDGLINLFDIEHKFKKRIAKRIKAIRKSKNINQSLASNSEKYGSLSDGRLSRIESGKKYATTGDIQVLSDTLNSSPNELIYGNDEETKKFIEWVVEKLAFQLFDIDRKVYDTSPDIVVGIDDCYFVSFEFLGYLSSYAFDQQFVESLIFPRALFGGRIIDDEGNILGSSLTSLKFLRSKFSDEEFEFLRLNQEAALFLFWEEDGEKVFSSFFKVMEENPFELENWHDKIYDWLKEFYSIVKLPFEITMEKPE